MTVQMKDQLTETQLVDSYTDSDLISILEITQEIVKSPLDLLSVLSRIVSAARRILDCDFALLLPYDSHSRSFEVDLFTASGLSDEVLKAKEKPRPGGVAAQVMSCPTGVLIVEDVGDRERYPYVSLEPTSLVPTSGARCFIGARMEAGGEVMGILFVDYCRLHAFVEVELTLVRLLANHAAIAIQNARVFDHISKSLEEKVEELKKLQSRQLAAERLTMLADIAANFAHRIGNDIGTIPVCVQEIRRALMIQPCDLRTADYYLGRIERDAKNFLHTAELLRMPFVDSEVGEIDINGAIYEAVNQMIVPPNTVVNFDLAESLPTVRCDLVQFINVIKGLIENAFEAMPDGGSLSIHTKVDQLESGGTQVVLEFADTGQAIPASQLPRIFELFYSTKKGSGMGVGLWICKAFVQRIGGDVQVESMVGSGTLFRITLPASTT